jgi:3-hydroxy-9,10-secoandrosta-1,3,5(10)-triene-9,17-dione monooxygenase reductase component
MLFDDSAPVNEDSSMFRDAFHRCSSYLPRSVAVVAALDSEQGPFGFTVSSLTMVSLVPALISLCVNGGSQRAQRLRSVVRFSANLLSNGQASLASRFAAAGMDRFQGVPWHRSDFGPPLLEGVLGVLLCQFREALEAGDHQLILAEVKELRWAGGEPLVHWRRAFHSLCLAYPFTEGETALEEFVASWKLGTLPKSQWSHGAHVAVAAYFAFDHTPEVAFEKMKAGILHFNTCVGTKNTEDMGYHETLTRFWSETVGTFVRAGQFASRLETVRRAVHRFGEDRDRHRLFYSYDVVRDPTARRTWRAPDRHPPACWIGTD